MTVQWNLAGPGFNALQSLQLAGQSGQQRLQQQKLAMEQAEAQRAAALRQQVGGMVQQGDYEGGASAAIGGGDFDLAKSIGGLGEAQRKQASAEARIMAAAASRLKAVPAEQRAQALASLAPALRQHGIGDDDLAGADLSDAGIDGYISLGKSVLDLTVPDDEPSIIQSLRAVGIDPASPEGRDIVTRNLAAPRVMPNGDGTFTVMGGSPMGAAVPSGNGGPQPGTVEDGYRFRGGNPADSSAWEPVGGAASQGAGGFP